MIKVLFVCLGNICRSPMAEAIFRQIVKEKREEQNFEIDSAGMGNWHVGKPPHQGTRDILDRYEISYQGQEARQIQEADWDQYDYIVAMDEQNMQDLEAFRHLNQQVVVKRLMDFVDNPKEQNVPDPYFTKNFDYTYELVKEGCEKLYHFLKNEKK
ncbi:low molecular weight protein-tyrosine-phosphatase [Saliterribacillus persicus]|uniref:protein-tyrosine-phosphatase n=1 Tax=Saliterribacillus persicus TaxID=930114 RepID=A0A368X5M3_9BACI|nr:low molecular weight protein-tyrosine-phosphatase [Saliterribacillus persicus]RCW62999.1 protein-tyrosine phosphatase [Saliterribacillus persicus]